MLIIGNGKTITRDANLPFIEDGAVAIEGTRIKEVGATKDMKEKYKDAEYIDARSGVIMPAFINTHEHIYSAMARGLRAIIRKDFWTSWMASGGPLTGSLRQNRFDTARLTP